MGRQLTSRLGFRHAKTQGALGGGAALGGTESDGTKSDEDEAEGKSTMTSTFSGASGVGVNAKSATRAPDTRRRSNKHMALALDTFGGSSDANEPNAISLATLLAGDAGKSKAELVAGCSSAIAPLAPRAVSAPAHFPRPV